MNKPIDMKKLPSLENSSTKIKQKNILSAQLTMSDQEITPSQQRSKSTIQKASKLFTAQNSLLIQKKTEITIEENRFTEIPKPIHRILRDNNTIEY